MLLTLYYMTTTWLQSWRLNSLKARLNQHLTSNASIVLYKIPENVTLETESFGPSSTMCLNSPMARVSEVLWHSGPTRMCSLIAAQRLSLATWIANPANPFLASAGSSVLSLTSLLSPTTPEYPTPLRDDMLGKVEHLQSCGFSPYETEENLHLLLEANLSRTEGIQSIEIQRFGSMVAWRVDGLLGIVVRSSLRQLTEIALRFMNGNIALKGGMELLRVQTILVEEEPVFFHDSPSLQCLCSGLTHSTISPSHWLKHVETLQVLSEKATTIALENIPLSIIETDNCVANCVDTTEKQLNELVKENGTIENIVEVKSLASTTSEAQIEIKDEIIVNDLTLDSRIIKNTEIENGISNNVVLASNVKESSCRKQSVGKTRRPSLKRSKMACNVTKPPNVLVYADSVLAMDNVKTALQSILHSDKYTIYSLTKEQVMSSVWMDNAMLVVVCGSVAPEVAPLLLDYLLYGGKLLCLCSDLIHTVLPTYKTAEVREHELVRFSYGRWQKVRMMHHIFCYQASPARKHFSHDSDDPPPVTMATAPPATPASVEVRDTLGHSHELRVKVLGAEETWHTPSLLLATTTQSTCTGQAVFSQVHLEVDPMQYESEESKYVALKESNGARLEILKDLLNGHLGLQCQDSTIKPQMYTPAYFLGRHELKLSLLSDLKSKMVDGTLKTPSLSLKFCGKGETSPTPSASLLPVMVHSCPDNFSTVEYFENLKSEHIGRLVIYSSVMTSSQEVLHGLKLQHGIAVIPQQQTRGTGRTANTWISPIGCAMFSLQLHIPLASVLGKRTPLVQHLVVSAVVSAVMSQPGYNVLDIGLKWPNDIYANSSTKIGGLFVTTVVESDLAICNIGCAVNLNNSNPTTCINDLITQHNANSGGNLALFSYERFLALIFTEIERVLDLVQGGDMLYLYELYYKYWLHNNAEITVLDEAMGPVAAVVEGIDDYGFLLVRYPNNKKVSVHPDGNSFDMLRGLIVPKMH